MTDWQPIETAPLDGTQIMLWSSVNGAIIAQWSPRPAFWDTGFASEMDGDPIEVIDPTHWMPLPKPPPSE